MIGGYVILRTQSAGVFAGILTRLEGKEAELMDARRIWYWEGAATLSELATRGTQRPLQCKFPAPVRRMAVTEAVEIIECSAEAEESIRGGAGMEKLRAAQNGIPDLAGRGRGSGSADGFGTADGTGYGSGSASGFGNIDRRGSGCGFVYGSGSPEGSGYGFEIGLVIPRP